MIIVNHVTKEIIHIISVNNMKTMLEDVEGEEATIYICVACKQWQVIALLKPTAERSAVPH